MNGNQAMTLVGISVALGLMGLLFGMIYVTLNPSFEDTLQKIMFVVIGILALCIIIFKISDRKHKAKQKEIKE